MLHAVLCLSKLCTAFCILVCVSSNMLFVFVCTHASLNVCVFDAYMKLIPGWLPAPTLVVPYQYTPQPFWSPALVMRPIIWDLLMFGPTKTSKRRKSTEQHLDEKMDKYFCKSLRLRPLKVVPRTSPPPPCSTNYCFKQKGELCSGEIGETLTCWRDAKTSPDHFSYFLTSLDIARQGSTLRSFLLFFISS